MTTHVTSYEYTNTNYVTLFKLTFKVELALEFHWLQIEIRYN